MMYCSSSHHCVQNHGHVCVLNMLYLSVRKKGVGALCRLSGIVVIGHVTLEKSKYVVTWYSYISSKAPLFFLAHELGMFWIHYWTAGLVAVLDSEIIAPMPH